MPRRRATIMRRRQHMLVAAVLCCVWNLCNGQHLGIATRGNCTAADQERHRGLDVALTSPKQTTETSAWHWDDEWDHDVTAIAALLPDHWNPEGMIAPLMKIRTNGPGDPPEQFVKVTDKKHKFPVLATICSMGFLLTIIGIIIIICTHS